MDIRVSGVQRIDMIVDEQACTGCAICVEYCPTEAIRMERGLPEFNESCVRCKLCVKLCPSSALSMPTSEEEQPEGVAICGHCMVACRVRDGYMGACQRYINVRGQLQLTHSLVIPPPVTPDFLFRQGVVSRPLITGIGAGTTYPDYEPAPLTAEDKIGDIDVVTCVTEAPLTYSSVLLKVDTTQPIGEETASVICKGRVVGHISTEQYGSKMISIGGINRMRESGDVELTKLMLNICNKELFELQVDGGVNLQLQVGKAPLINGKESEPMKIGCGTGVLAIFGKELRKLADEVIILDADITCLASESYVGSVLGFERSGIKPPGIYASPGRYFGLAGAGWGGTIVTKPADALEIVQRERIRPGLRVLILEVTGNHAALVEADKDAFFKEVALPPQVTRIVEIIRQNQEPPLTSALYLGGAGGSARAGVTQNPIKLNRAIKAGKVRLSVGGAPATVFPGGGINFMVDVGQMCWRTFSWVPFPALVVPVEYTMEKETYIELGGHLRNLRLLSDIKNRLKDYRHQQK
jgi:ferredoxin